MQCGHNLIPAPGYQPGLLMNCVHPTHGCCRVHVGQGTRAEIFAAMERCGTVPSVMTDEAFDRTLRQGGDWCAAEVRALAHVPMKLNVWPR